jgi:hypothetical protein
MAKVLKTSLSVVLEDQEIAKSNRFMDEAITHEPLSHESGEANLPGAMTDHPLAAGINQIAIISTSAFSVKIGNTTSPEHNNMKMFVYDGESTDIFVSNKGVDPIVIKYASAKYSLA